MSDEESGSREPTRRRFIASAAAALGTSALPTGVAWSGVGADTALYGLDISELGRLIAAREVSPVEVTGQMLARIAARDPEYGSYITVMTDSAMAAARVAEQELLSGRVRGPLHGVPVAVKDLCATKGVRTTGGLHLLVDNVPQVDATVVAKLEQAGAILLGKLNLTEGAMTGYHKDFAIPRNPWGEDRWVGGSSSGSGVATAMALCYGSLGSDTGGSIRYPSAACGIVGLKPTYGRVSRFGVLPLAESMDHVGPMTRSSLDAALMLDAIAGYDANDPTSSVAAPPHATVGIDDGVGGLRIGFDERGALDGLDSSAATAIEAVLSVLRRGGATIVPVKMPKADGAAWWTLCSAEAALAHTAHFPSQQDAYGAYFREFLAFGSQVTGAQYAKAHQQRVAYSAQLANVIEALDCLVCPTVPGVSFHLPPQTMRGSIAEFGKFWPVGFNRFTEGFDFSGSPTLSTPCGFSEKGLPFSVQFVGHHFDEARLCRVGHSYERETGWLKHRPPGFDGSV